MPRRAQLGARSARVEVVEHARDLHAGGVDQFAGGGVGADDQLTCEELARGHGELERVVLRKVREVGGHRLTAGRQRERFAAHDLAVLDLEPARGGHVQPIARGGRRVPREQAAPQPVRGDAPVVLGSERDLYSNEPAGTANVPRKTPGETWCSRVCAHSGCQSPGQVGQRVTVERRQQQDSRDDEDRQPPCRRPYTRTTKPAGGTVSDTALPLRRSTVTVWPTCPGSVE